MITFIQWSIHVVSLQPLYESLCPSELETKRQETVEVKESQPDPAGIVLWEVFLGKVPNPWRTSDIWGPHSVSQNEDLISPEGLRQAISKAAELEK